MTGNSRYVNQFYGSVRVTQIIIVLGLLGVFVGAVWAGGCDDLRAQNCNPGYYSKEAPNQEYYCAACTGNTFANGCTNFCSPCPKGTVPTPDHSACVVL